MNIFKSIFVINLISSCFFLEVFTEIPAFLELRIVLYVSLLILCDGIVTVTFLRSLKSKIIGGKFSDKIAIFFRFSLYKSYRNFYNHKM